MKKMFSAWCMMLEYARRLVLVFVFLLCATAMFGTSYYGKFTARAATGGGKVYVNTRNSEPNTAQYQDAVPTETSSSAAEQKAYLFSLADDGYYLQYWKKEGSDAVFSSEASGVEVKVDATASKNDKNKRVDGGTYLAYFTPVLVNSGANAAAPIAVTDIYVADNSLTTAHTNTGVVTFSVTGADATSDFETPTLVGSPGFSYQKTEYASGVISVTVQYQDQNIDNVNGANKPDLQATIILRSKGDTDGSKTKSAVITATSNLTPNFTVNPSEGKAFIDLTPSAPMNNDATLTASLAKVLNDAASTPTTINVTPKNNVANAGQWSISFKDAADAANKGFSLSGDVQSVSFKPTEAYKNTVDIATVICVQCSYTDINSKVISQVHEITISADAGGVITIQNQADGLMLTNAAMVLDVVYGESGDATTTTIPFMTTLSGITQTLSPGFPTDYITSSLQDGDTKLSISVKNTLSIGQHNHTITFASSGVTATLNLTVNVRLEKPVITPIVGIGQSIQLDWQDVYGASNYILKSGATTIATIPAASSTYTVNQYNGQSLSTLAEYAFTVTAVYEPNTFGNSISDEVRVTPSMPTIIEKSSLSGISMYTGTDQSGAFPYKAKQPIDLTHIFDANGNALFDELYIFGLTTNTSGGTTLNMPSESVPCNAQTPCYIYNKISATSYQFSQEIDAAAKRFDHNTSKNGKKLYFTGYCPFAYMGTTLDHEGWMYFRGGDATVDLYLENCDMRGRYKTPTGINSGYSDRLDISLGSSYFHGFSSIFVFNSTSSNEAKPYKPSIHIRGNNHLKGQGGFLEYVYVVVISGLLEKEYLRHVPVISAPITIKPDKNNCFTALAMDDVWPAVDDKTEITNGYLRLDSYTVSGEASERGLCVDLGSKYGSLTINGGQYHLRNSAADYNYTCNLAIAYRYYEGSLDGETALATLYGFGSDATECKVVINSGTFTMYKNVYEGTGGGYYYDQDNFMDLRLPAGGGASRVNGGTFNGISNVLMCSNVMSSGASPKNAAGFSLCMQNVLATGTNSYGGSTFEIPEPFNAAYLSSTPIYDLSTAENLNKVTIPEDVYAYYGAQSVNANEGTVRVLLPIDACDNDCEDCELIEEAIYYNWSTIPPEIELKMAATPMTMGGSIEVPTTGSSIHPEGADAVEYRVNNLLYGDLAGLEGYSASVSGGDATVKLANDNYTRGQVTNANPYFIERNINYVRTFEADRWYCFVAPFNVHDVSVFEIGESDVSSQANRDNAIRLQSEYNLRIWETLYYAILPINGRASGRTLLQVLGGAVNAIPLEHYNGGNIATANYYLYRLESEEFSTDATGDNLNITWLPVEKPAPGAPILEKGKVYAIQFPYCPMCGDLATRDYYDYWTNKYILFHGSGRQQIEGTNHHSTILATNPSTGNAILTGNSTLADYTLPAGFVHDMETSSPTYDYFVYKEGQTIKPSQGYMLYNPATAQMPVRISRAGQIEYAEGETTGIGGVPTVGDRSTLMLFGAFDGFEVLSLGEQLVVVYDLQGNIIFKHYMNEGERAHVSTGVGVFIVRGEFETIKVVVD